MLKVEKESMQIAKIIEVADAVEQLMFDGSDHLEEFPHILNIKAGGRPRRENKEDHFSELKRFEKFDASFKIDEMTQFEESFNFATFGLDSSHCTSTVSDYTKNFRV